MVENNFHKIFHLKYLKPYKLMPTITLINTFPKSKDLVPENSLFFHNSLAHHPAIELRRIKIFKAGFSKLSIFSKFWERRKWLGVGYHLVCIIMTHWVRKSICNSLVRIQIYQYSNIANIAI